MRDKTSCFTSRLTLVTSRVSKTVLEMRYQANSSMPKCLLLQTFRPRYRISHALWQHRHHCVKVYVECCVLRMWILFSSYYPLRLLHWFSSLGIWSFGSSSGLTKSCWNFGSIHRPFVWPSCLRRFLRTFQFGFRDFQSFTVFWLLDRIDVVPSRWQILPTHHWQRIWFTLDHHVTVTARQQFCALSDYVQHSRSTCMSVHVELIFHYDCMHNPAFIAS